MLASAISDPECEDCSEGPAMATEGPTKRARIEVKPFEDIDLSKIALKDKGKGKQGHIAFPLLDGEVIRFNLTPSDWSKNPFGFDVNSKFEKPSFLGGKEPEKVGTSEGLSLRVDLQTEQAEFLKKLDMATKDAFALLVDNKWNELVASNPLFPQPTCKITVILKGSGLTEIAVVRDGKVHRGEGWNFLEPHIEPCNYFKFAEVKLTVRVKKLWNVAGKAGLGLEATHLVLRPTDRPTVANPFEDDEELLA